MEQTWMIIDRYNLILHRAGFAIAVSVMVIGVVLFIAYIVKNFLDKFKER